MKFNQVLRAGRLVKRYKRFLADFVFDDGEALTVHCPNTGAMTGCAEPGCRVWCSLSDNPKRKYAYTWELACIEDQMICINTHRANGLVEEAIRAGQIGAFSGFSHIQTEVKFGEGSRIDLLLSGDEKMTSQCFVEVKSVTLPGENGLALFPDAVSVRAQKHLRELMAQVAQGNEASLVFCVNRTGVDAVAPADHIDPEYGRLLREANDQGVKLIALSTLISPQVIRIDRELPVILG